MNITDLRKNLAIISGSVTIGPETVPTADFNSFLQNVFGGNKINITNAHAGPNDQGNVVQIQGNASRFLNVENANITATFTVDPATGSVSADIAYELINGPNTTWKFSKSFPNLPVTYDFSTDMTSPQTSPLDDLDLVSAWFHATTNATTITVSVNGQNKPVNLQPGLNFVGVFRPLSALPVFGKFIANDILLPIWGPIIPATQASKTVQPLPYKTVNYPWVYNPTAPGITLKADLGIQVSLSNKLALDKTYYIVYSPIDRDWWANNPTYQPLAAFGASLEIPSANIKLDLTTAVLKGFPKIVITGDFENVTVGSLADLVDLAGTDKLITNMPEPLQDSIKNLEKLEIQEIAISITSQSTGISIQYIYLTVGFSNINWTIIKDDLDITGLSSTIIINDPFSPDSNISVVVDGQFEIENNVDIEIEAGAPDFFIAGQLKNEQTINLQSLMNKYLPSVPAPSALTINTLDVGYDTASQVISMSCEMADNPAWHIPVGKNGITIADVQFNFSRNYGSTPSTTGSFQGSIQFNEDIFLYMSYTIPGDFYIRGDFPSVSLTNLINWVCNAQNVLPSGFDLNFINSTILIQKSGDTDFEFYFATEVADYGSLCFVVQENNSVWGFALGMEVNTGKIEDLPALSSLKPIISIFPFNKVILAISTVGDPNFQFPDMNMFQNPQITSKKIQLPPSSKGMQEGFYFYGETAFASNSTLLSLGKFFGISSDTVLDFALFVGIGTPASAKLSADISTTISGMQLAGEFGAQMQGDAVSFYLQGKVNVIIQSQPVEFDVTLLVVENGFFISGNMDVTGDKKTVDFSIFKLNSLAIEAGMSLEGEPSFGFSAVLDIADIDSSIAVFIDSADPTQSMLAGAISDINLKTVVDELLGNHDPLPDFLQDVLGSIGLGGISSFSSDFNTYHVALNNYDFKTISQMFLNDGKIKLPDASSQVLLIVNEPDNKWFLTDLLSMRHYELEKNNNKINVSLEAQIYCVPNPSGVTIGTKFFPSGTYLSATIDYLIIKETLQVEIYPNKGVAIDFQMQPIVIGNENIFYVTGANKQGGPQLLLCTFNDPNNTNVNFRTPQFKISGEANILGIEPSVDIDIGKDVFKISIEETTFFGTSFNLDIDITGPSGLQGKGQASLGINKTIDLGSLGSIPIDDTINPNLSFSVNATAIDASASLSITLLSQTFNIGTIALDISTSPFAHLPTILEGAIEDYFKNLLKDAKAWLSLVYDGIITGFQDLEKLGNVLKNVFNLAGKEAAILMQSVGYTLEEVSKILTDTFDFVEEEAQNILNFLYKGLSGCPLKSALVG